MKNLLFAYFLVVIAESCSTVPAQKQQDEIAVLVKAEELVGAMYYQDIGKVWDMMSPVVRRESSETGIESIKQFIQRIKITDYDSSKIVIVGEKFAITQAEITHDLREGDQIRAVTICERTFWLKFTDGWYWHNTGVSCDHRINFDEINRLTRNLR